MIQTFTSRDFKCMPWKNGGGVTTEIFRIPSIENESFLFRLSRATVASDGPFSQFPEIDRLLLLIEGDGMHLNWPDKKIELVNKLEPISFTGEEPFTCTLVNGPCIDFNVMTARKYAKSSISVFSPDQNTNMNFKAEYDLKFIYDINHETLTCLRKSDHCDLQIVKENTLLVIDVNLL